MSVKTLTRVRRAIGRPPLQLGRAAALCLLTLSLAGCQSATDSANSVDSSTPAGPPTPAPTPLSGVTPTALPSPTKVAAAPLLYVPGTDDLLHPHAFRDQKDDAKNLNQLIALAPLYYPKGTRVLSFIDSDQAKHVTVDLSAPFNDQKFYSRGESITELAINALVTSASALARDPKKPVQLTVEGKALSTLGEFDASDPMLPDHNLVAKP